MLYFLSIPYANRLLILISSSDIPKNLEQVKLKQGYKNMSNPCSNLVGSKLFSNIQNLVCSLMKVVATSFYFVYNWKTRDSPEVWPSYPFPSPCHDVTAPHEVCLEVAAAGAR
jgi:hypothetical protein